jgi:U3 small nucleolar RNA-associated protein 10
LKHTAVTCVDLISEKFGKKDVELVAMVADAISGQSVLGSNDNQLRVISILCLASLTDILGGGMVPILPQILPKMLEYLQSSIETNGQRLHNAIYSFLNVLAQHLPYMITGNYLDRILKTSHVSAESNLGDEADESRKQLLHVIARSVDAKEVFNAIQRTWQNALKAGAVVSVLLQHLGVVF